MRWQSGESPLSVGARRTVRNSWKDNPAGIEEQDRSRRRTRRAQDRAIGAQGRRSDNAMQHRQSQLAKSVLLHPFHDRESRVGRDPSLGALVEPLENCRASMSTRSACSPRSRIWIVWCLRPQTSLQGWGDEDDFAVSLVNPTVRFDQSGFGLFDDALELPRRDPDGRPCIVGTRPFLSIVLAAVAQPVGDLLRRCLAEGLGERRKSGPPYSAVAPSRAVRAMSRRLSPGCREATPTASTNVVAADGEKPQPARKPPSTKAASCRPPAFG